MLLDIHTHAFHPKIASKAVAQLESHYGITMSGSGLLEDLDAVTRKAGLDGYVVHNAATAAAQVVPANNFAMALSLTCPRAVAFGSIHPDYEEWEAQLKRLQAHGIRGIKLHPEFQGFWLDDPRLEPIFETIGDSMMIMCHIGDALPPDENPSCPYKLAALIKKFPRVRFIAAHMGGYRHWKYALEALAGKNVYMDTSSSLAFIDDDTLHGLWKKHPREQWLFGSDWPLFDPASEQKMLRKRLGISDSALADLMGNGALALGLRAQY
ncbi:amidohydrolase family protein [Oleidesulfovibrio alaskensis]|uniref:amidohydrolase family protein n=1 Tax=Oleidesulfovibrio alaskensis TaxID=58180 RepID=UPI0003FCCFD2|nr:amidohydrolase family protein [Oleidesulfovibrio alaskensis]